MRHHGLSTWQTAVEFRPPAEHVSGTVHGNTIYASPATTFAASTRVIASDILLLLLSPRVADAVASAAQSNPW